MATIDLGIMGGQRGSIDSIKAEYVEMLTPLKERLGDIDNGLTSMPLMKGKYFTKSVYGGKPFRILFVGRAVNGWEIPFNNNSVEEMVNQVFDSAINMKDIANGKVFDENGKMIYNYNRSPFFQLCRAILNQFDIQDDWSEHMAWTNLYKVAPYKTGNPCNSLIRETLNSCANILGAELFYLRPTHIVFITDSWWYKPNGRGLDELAFINETGVDLYEDTSKTIVGSGIGEMFYSPKIVITKRPESAKISRADHAKAVFAAFNAIKECEKD